jgi:hypothetical protein
MILLLSLLLTFVYNCLVFVVAVDPVMVFYVSALCSGNTFQLFGGTYSLHFGLTEIVQVHAEVIQRKKCFGCVGQFEGVWPITVM